MGVVYIEQGPRFQGPSKLDERLERHRDMESGEILLSQDEAKEILLETLLAYYRKEATARKLPEEIHPSTPKTSTKIEALVEIAERVGSADRRGRFNYNQIKRELDSVRSEKAKQEQKTEAERIRREDGILGGPEHHPTQPEV